MVGTTAGRTWALSCPRSARQPSCHALRRSSLSPLRPTTTLFASHRELVAIHLDRKMARSMGLRAFWLDLLPYVMVTLAVVISVQTIGNIPAPRHGVLGRLLLRRRAGAGTVAAWGSVRFAGLGHGLWARAEPGQALRCTSTRWPEPTERSGGVEEV